METFKKQTLSRGNKNKYKCLRKSKRYMAPFVSVYFSPGILTLTTYHYQTRNYIMCEHVISSWRMNLGCLCSEEDMDLDGYELQNISVDVDITFYTNVNRYVHHI